jgi:S1-C subfamily serine protease
MRIRPWIAGAALGALTLAASSADQTPGDAALLREAGEALAQGRTQRALSLYETVAHRGESLEAELGLIRASLKAGAFRQAMAFANLTAGEHRESAEAQALLAWLLDRTGQTEIALRDLRKLQSAQPAAFAPVAAEADILIDRAAAPQAVSLLDRWQAKNPGSRTELARVRARLVPAAQAGGNGVIIDEGRRVLTVRAALGNPDGRFRVRNARGETRDARLDAAGSRGELQVLVLSQPFPAGWSIPYERFASPEDVHISFVLGYSTPGVSDPGFPAISTGVVLRPDTGVARTLQITSALAVGHIGSPVFDPRGRLIGMSLAPGAPRVDGEDLGARLGKGQFALRVDSLRPATIKPLAPPQGPLAPPEEVYEGLAPAIVTITPLP